MPYHETIATAAAPAAIGPYSQAVALDLGGRSLLFLAGQIALDPATGEIVEGPVQAQVERVMRNIEAVLVAAGSDFAHVLKTTIFVADLGDFAAVNEVYGRFFGDRPPARSTVQAAGLPKGVSVEIEVVAYARSA